MWPTNERRRYNVTPSLIGRAHTKKYPWCLLIYDLVYITSHDLSETYIPIFSLISSNFIYSIHKVLRKAEVHRVRSGEGRTACIIGSKHQQYIFSHSWYLVFRWPFWKWLPADIWHCIINFLSKLIAILQHDFFLGLNYFKPLSYFIYLKIDIYVLISHICYRGSIWDSAWQKLYFCNNEHKNWLINVSMGTNFSC